MFLVKTYNMSKDGLDPATATQLTVYDILEQVDF